MPVPRKVSLGGSHVTIDWSDGHRSVHANRSLRESCPCAICSGEPSAIGLGRAIPLIPAAPEGVLSTGYRMVGRYAISFAWSDGHSTGIYPYEYLLSICECDACAAEAEKRRTGRGEVISER